MKSLTIPKPKNINEAPTYIFFRVSFADFPQTDEYAHSMLTVSACTGLVQLHMTNCSKDQPNCDDGTSDAWFPTEELILPNDAKKSTFPLYQSNQMQQQQNSDNNKNNQFSSSFIVGQPDVSFGKLPMTQQQVQMQLQEQEQQQQQHNVTYFFGVQIMEWDRTRDDIQINVLLQFFRPSQVGIGHSYLMLKKLRAAKLGQSVSLTWKRAIYCLQVESEQRSNNCTLYDDLDSVSSYTVYTKRLTVARRTGEVVSMFDANMGTVCGMKMVRGRDQIQTGGANSATVPIEFDGSPYILSTSMHVLDSYGKNPPLDAVYEPLVYRTIPDQRPGEKAAFIALLIVIIIVLGLTLVGSIAAAHVYMVHKRRKELAATSSMNFDHSDLDSTTFDQSTYGGL